jgi:O-antigen ligase
MIPVGYVALWIFIFSLPWEGVIVTGGTAVVPKLTGMIAVASAALAVTLTGRLRRWHLFHVAALLFVLVAGVNLFFTAPQGHIPAKYYTFVQLFLVLWMIWEIARSPRAVHGLLLAYVSGAYVAALLTLTVLHSHGAAMRRYVAGDFDPNDLAMTLTLAVPMAWYLGTVFQNRVLRLFCRAYLPLGLLAVGLTGSRGGMLTAGVALMIVPLSMTKLTPGRLIAAMITLAITATVAATYVPEKVVERLATTSGDISRLSFGGRFKFWVAGLEAFTHKPLMGYGTGGFVRAIYPILGSVSLVAHNSFISLLVEEGIVGLLLYVTMMLAVLGAALRLPKFDRRFALLLLATLFVAMSPLTWEDRKPVWFILAALLGLSQATLAARASAQGQAPASQPSVRPPMEIRPRPGPRPRASWEARG